MTHTIDYLISRPTANNSCCHPTLRSSPKKHNQPPRKLLARVGHSFLLSLLVAAGFFFTASPSDAFEVKVLQYNVWYSGSGIVNRGSTVEEAREDSGKMISELSPDIITIEEFEEGDYTAQGYLDKINESLPPYAGYTYKDIQGEGSENDHTILYKSPRYDFTYKTDLIKESNKATYIAARFTVQDGPDKGKEFVVANIWLSHFDGPAIHPASTYSSEVINSTYQIYHPETVDDLGQVSEPASYEEKQTIFKDGDKAQQNIVFKQFLEKITGTEEFTGLPLIVAGDFNARSHLDDYDLLLPNSDLDANPPMTENLSFAHTSHVAYEYGLVDVLRSYKRRFGWWDGTLAYYPLPGRVDHIYAAPGVGNQGVKVLEAQVKDNLYTVGYSYNSARFPTSPECRSYSYNSATYNYDTADLLIYQSWGNDYREDSDICNDCDLAIGPCLYCPPKCNLGDGPNWAIEKVYRQNYFGKYDKNNPKYDEESPEYSGESPPEADSKGAKASDHNAVFARITFEEEDPALLANYIMDVTTNAKYGEGSEKHPVKKAVDLSSSYTSGKASGVDSTYDRYGSAYRALDFSEDDSVIDIPRNLFGNYDLDSRGVSFSFWLNSTTTKEYETFFEAVGDAGKSQIRIQRYLMSTNLRYTLVNDGIWYSAFCPIIPEEEWAHFVVTQSPGKEVKFYKNGVENKDCAVNIDPEAKQAWGPVSWDKISIGNSSMYPEYEGADGLLDDFKIYRKVLSKEEVHQHSALAFYDFDQSSLADFHNNGFGGAGDRSQGYEYAAGVDCVEEDGSANECVQILDSPASRIVLGVIDNLKTPVESETATADQSDKIFNGFSVCGMFKSFSPVNMDIASECSYDVVDQSWAPGSWSLGVNDTGEVQFVAGEYGENVAVGTPMSNYFDGAWHRICGLYDVNELAIYVDGYEIATSSAPVNIPNTDIEGGIPNTDIEVVLGNCSEGTVSGTGFLDKVYLFDRVLTPSETWPDLETMVLTVDIQPGDSQNLILIPIKKKTSTTTVAILGSADFDVTSVNLKTLHFGPSEAAPVGLKKKDKSTPSERHLEDVDSDGYDDLVARFKNDETGIVCGDTSAKLFGETMGGQPFEATGRITTGGKVCVSP